ncbi:MAG: CaiB/BaiF CoA-transferase family protein [Burkholderiaceae bacterium]|nr:CaiB/BaiF CoA-transferase family protein [Burkholderiaceae bacterium]
MQALKGIRVLDFSTLLPGPMATLILAEAGADVVKVERPNTGDDLRGYSDKLGPDSVSFASLNRGKRSVAVDLKGADALQRLRPLIEAADVVVEQFRPGVMDRLGFGYEALKRINPGVIYCSITGFGQYGPKRDLAAHDLNYVAQSGMLSRVQADGGGPTLPIALIADIGGGTYPAVINILMALFRRTRDGQGCHLDVSMHDNLLPLMYATLAAGFGMDDWPGPGAEITTGASPRYNIYATSDGRHVAAGPLEDKFWNNFCDVIGLPGPLRATTADPAVVRAAVAGLIRARDAAHWRAAFAGRDVCADIIASVEEGARDPHYEARGLFAHRLLCGGKELPAAPVPLDAGLRGAPDVLGYPSLGEANELLG